MENLELAKTYYCQALKLNPDNMRALLGLFLVCGSTIFKWDTIILINSLLIKNPESYLDLQILFYSVSVLDI